jgi:PKD repeat protein
MRTRMKSLVLLLILTICIGLSPVGAAVVTSGNLPISFMENRGQVDESVLFLADTPGLLIYFTPGGEIFYAPASGRIEAVSVTYPGANPGTVVKGSDLLSGKANFLYGRDSTAWVTNIPTYRGITYEDLYDGISLRYTGVNDLLEREFVVEPGADPDAIIMQYAGHDRLSFNDFGGLVVSTSIGDLIEGAPVCYQMIDGERVNVACSYVIGESGTVSFAVGAYQKSLPLIIDPVLDFSTYYGGNSDDAGEGIALDDQGNIYFTGSTLSTNLPLPNAPIFQEHLNGTWDAFVAKFSSDGQTLIYATYLGGNSTDKATGITVIQNTSLAAGGRATICGYTESSDFPLMNPYQATKYNKSDVFVTRLNADGDGLIWSTYLGGNETEEAYAIASASGGAPVVVGFTSSGDFPHFGGTWTTANTLMGAPDAFMTRFDNNGNPTVSAFLGGTGADYANGVALDALNRIYITGTTDSFVFPTVPGSYRVTPQGRIDAFATRLNAAGDTLQFSTYLGGTKDDFGTAIAVDLNNYTYVAGYTNSAIQPIDNFPISPTAFQKTFGGGKYDGFVTKLEPAGDSINYSTYLGGLFEDRIYGIKVDNLSEAYVTGFTISDNFPTMYADPPFHNARDGLVSDAFLTELNATGTGLLFSTYWGGTYYDEANDIAITDDGLNITLTGFTESFNFPIQNAYQDYLAAFPPVRRTDAFVTKIVKKPPVADFIGEPRLGCSPLFVNFTDLSTTEVFPITSWYWDFGDGSNSTEQNPNHTYSHSFASNRSYNVSLTATNIDGSNTMTKIRYIKVCPTLIADFHTNKTGGCIDNSSNNSVIRFFDDSVPTPLERYWDFGDGTNQTTASANVNHNYTQPGVYNVSLTAIGTCCNNTTTKYDLITIGQVPVADFNATPTKGFLPLFVQFNDNSSGNPTSWEWQFPLAEGISYEQNPNHTYNLKKNYTVRLYVCNFCGCDWANKSNYIKVGDPLIAGFTVNKTSGFAPLKVGFFDATVGTPDTWFWDFGDGTNQTESSNVTVVHIFDEEGEYNVTLNVSNFYGYDVSDPVTITVGERATVFYTPDTLIVPTNTTTKVNLTLSRAPYGLAGYNITVWWDDSANGNFTTAKFPAWANLTSKGPLPAPSVDLEAVDLNGDVDPGATDVPLAYFNVTGLIAGDAFLRVTVHEMNDDIGGNINPKVVAAKVSVENLFIFPGKTKIPTDPFEDQLFWDVNGNGRIDFNDVITYFQNMQWIRDNQYIPFFDYNGNGNIDFNDVILLFQKV